MEQGMRICAIFGCLVSAVLVEAATTPLDAPLPEDGTALIECDYDVKADEAKLFGASLSSEDPGRVVGVGTYHYRLYVPRSYQAKTDERYPVLFIASPGGRAKIGRFAARAKRDRWIVCMLVESRNGSPDWLANFLAAHDDVVKRMRVIDDMKFSTGMSGGSRCASAQPLARKTFRGVVMQAAGFWYDKSGYRFDSATRNRQLLFYGLFGVKDNMNWAEVAKMPARIPAANGVRMEIFEGGHTWAPKASIERAFDWLEQQVFLPSTKSRPAPGLKPSKEACLWYWRKESALLESAKSDFERYDIMERLVSMASRSRLRDKAIKDKVKVFKKTIASLKRDKSLKAELMAKKNFALADKNDTRVNMRKAKIASQVRGLYEQIAKKYSGTVYGAKAAARLKSLDLDSSR
jgi:hypothetical protein